MQNNSKSWDIVSICMHQQISSKLGTIKRFFRLSRPVLKGPFALAYKRESS